jgi:hypothetical protein
VPNPFPHCGTASQPASRLASRQAQQSLIARQTKEAKRQHLAKTEGQAGRATLRFRFPATIGHSSGDLYFISLSLPPPHSGSWLPTGQQRKGKANAPKFSSDLRTDQRLSSITATRPTDHNRNSQARRTGPIWTCQTRLNTNKKHPFTTGLHGASSPDDAPS